MRPNSLKSVTTKNNRIARESERERQSFSHSVKASTAEMVHGGGTKARLVMVLVMLPMMAVEGKPMMPLSEEGDCLVDDSVKVEGVNLRVSLLAYVSYSTTLDMGYFFPGLDKMNDFDSASINSTGATHREVRGGKGPITPITLPRLIPEGWNTFLVEVRGNSVTVTLVLGQDTLTLFTLPSLRKEVHSIQAEGKVARCPTAELTPTWEVKPDHKALVVLHPAGGSTPNQWLEVDGAGWGAAAPYLVFPFTPSSRVNVSGNSTFMISSSVRGDHIHCQVFKVKTGGGGDGYELVTSGNVTSNITSLKVEVGGGRGGDDDSNTTTFFRLQRSPPHTKLMNNSVSSSSPDYITRYYVPVWLKVSFVVVVLVLAFVVVINVMRGCGLQRRLKGRKSTKHADAGEQVNSISLHMNDAFRGVGSEEGISGHDPLASHPLLFNAHGTPMQRGTTHAGDISSDRCERSEKRGSMRTIQDWLSRPENGDSSAVKHDNSNTFISNGKSIVLHCEETLSNESSETDKAVSAELQNLFSPIVSKSQLDTILNNMSVNEGAKNLTCEPGILYLVFSIMKLKCDRFTQLERLAVISLGEMSINSESCDEKGSDAHYKPHEKLQVVMLSGLLGKWKLPIFYNFDVIDMTQTLMTLIKEAERAGYPVVALVHDLGSRNVKMWEALGIDPVGNKISFKNPAADRDIYVFADVPHLLKQIRNNFIDSGFYLEDGTIISDSCIRDMLTVPNTEYGLAYDKVSEMHLNISGQQRKQVGYATQLLSNSCSRSVKCLGEKGLLSSEYWEETAEFLNITDEWFDVLNSSHKFGDKKTRNAFGVNLCDQINVLHRMIETMKIMKVKDPQYEGLYMFQKGIILSSHSLIGLFNMLHESFNVEYILTIKLNQDDLDNLFERIRQMHGSSDHPNAVSFKFGLKKVLLGKEVALLSEEASTCADNFDSVYRGFLDGSKC